MNKVCPLSIIGKSNQAAFCWKDKCMFWETENNMCLLRMVLISMHVESIYFPQGGDDKDVT